MIKKLIPGLAGITAAIFLFLSLSTGAAEVTHMPYEKVLPGLSNVLILNVRKVERNREFKQFDGKKQVLVSSTVSIHGTIIEQLLGNTDREQLVAEYVDYEPFIYSEKGELEVSYSPILKSSGYENDVEAGNSYIASFSTLDTGSAVPLVRIDKLEDKSEIQKLISKHQQVNK